MSNENDHLRLTKDFIPSHYEISLDIDIINLSYISKVEINIISQIDNPKYLALNSKSYSDNSTLINYILIKENESENYIIKYLPYCPSDYKKTISSVYFSLKSGIKKGEKLTFKCEKNDEIKTSIEGYGLYISFWDYKLRKLLDEKKFEKNLIKSFFKEKNNPKIEEFRNNYDFFKSLVISLNCSPIAFREIVPCFDEPIFKSTYRFTISVNKNYANSSKYFTIVNNADINNIKEEGDKKIYFFKKIPKISCYLLTFTIGYYEYIEKNIILKNNKKLRLRVYGPENQLNKVDYCLSITENALKKYENMLNIPLYLDSETPVEKIDSIFIPNLNFTAMEFLGCITYKQEMMMDKYNTSSNFVRINIKDIYHEVFHNWVGNMVTMKFFDNTWLNEGTTKFVENYVTLNFGKGFWDDNLRTEYYYTLTYRDHSLNNKYLKDEDMIWYNFDNITYNKGGYIIYMLLSYFGEEKIFKGLKLYCENFKYRCADENNFFKIMSEVCDYDIKDFLNEWVYKKSYPILSVKFSENKEEIILKQKPSFNELNTIFKIPIFIKTKNLEKVILMKEENLVLNLNDFNICYEDIQTKNNFIVINNDIKCFCLVKYLDEELKNAIFEFYNNYNDSKNLNKNIKNVSDADIYQILISYLIKNNFDDFLNFIKKLKKVKNYEILYCVLYKYGNKKKNEDRFFKEDINNNNKTYNQSYYKSIYEIIDYNNIELVNKILEKFGNPTNQIEDDYSGQIEYEKFFITILCLYKRDEKLVLKIYEIFKKNNFDLYKINKTYRTYLPLILSEFMYLFPDNEKIIIYKSIYKYYEEMFYYFYFIDKSNFEKALHNLNNGVNNEILDFYFENFNADYQTQIDSIIIDYFFKYLNQLYIKNKGDKDIKFQDYLYDICINKYFEINDNKLIKIYNCYEKFMDKYHFSFDKEKLINYCNENYLHLNEINDTIKIEELKDNLKLS